MSVSCCRLKSLAVLLLLQCCVECMGFEDFEQMVRKCGWREIKPTTAKRVPRLRSRTNGGNDSEHDGVLL
jgi:hypothetical protein